MQLTGISIAIIYFLIGYLFSSIFEKRNDEQTPQEVSIWIMIFWPVGVFVLITMIVTAFLSKLADFITKRN